MVIGCSVLGAAAAAQSNNAGVDTALQGLQSIYLSQPPQHFYAGSLSDDGNANVHVDFAALLKPPTNHIYLNGSLLQRTVQADKALAAFWNDPNVGPAIQAAAAHPLLVSELPQTPFNGMDAVNSSPTIFRRIRRIKGVKGGVAKPQAGKTKGLAALRIASLRLAATTALTNYTTIMSRNPQGNGYTLFVMGQLPEAIDSSIPVNYTLEARQYTADQKDTAGNALAQNHTVIDRVALPVGTTGKRYFCFAYNLLPLAASSKETLVASYWASALEAQEEAVGLGSGANGQIVAVPAIQVHRYFNFRGDNAALTNCSLGESLAVERQKQTILLILQRRKAFFQSHPYAAARLKRRLAALSSGNS